jgi:hypothetical protein
MQIEGVPSFVTPVCLAHDFFCQPNVVTVAWEQAAAIRVAAQTAKIPQEEE